MDNKDFWASISAIIRNGFDREGLNKLQQAAAQAIVIEQWARAVGCWTDNVDNEFENIFGIQLAEGGEAHVYDNGASIVKK